MKNLLFVLAVLLPTLAFGQSFEQRLKDCICDSAQLAQQIQIPDQIPSPASNPGRAITKSALPPATVDCTIEGTAVPKIGHVVQVQTVKGCPTTLKEGYMCVPHPDKTGYYALVLHKPGDPFSFIHTSQQSAENTMRHYGYHPIVEGQHDCQEAIIKLYAPPNFPVWTYKQE
jgi:hypothetical protein